MEPTLTDQSLVLVKTFGLKPLKIGDLVLFVHQRKPLLKRVKEKSGNRYFLAGDNSRDSLVIGWVDHDQIKGKIVFKI
jgi:hypothetical protein